MYDSMKGISSREGGKTKEIHKGFYNPPDQFRDPSLPLPSPPPPKDSNNNGDNQAFYVE
jgi:hypothetical protein